MPPKDIFPENEAAEIRPFLKWLLRFVAGQTTVQKVILFGSFARGDASAGSDVDVAFVLQEPSAWPEIADQIAQNPATLRKVDAVCLNRTSPEFTEKILNEGRTIFERG